MPLFGRKTIHPKCIQQLQSFADENIVVELEQFDPNGRIGGSGKSRIQQFDPTAMAVYLDIPSKSGRPIMIGPGDMARVFIIQETLVYKFESTVLERDTIRLANGQALPMIVLEAPEILENGNRRRHFRVSPLSSARASIQWRPAPVDRKAKNDKPFNKSTVNDISGRGAGIWVEGELALHMQEGRRLELMIQVTTSQGATSIKTNAVIRRIVPSPDEVKPAFFGLEFEVESRDPEACLEEIVSYVTFCQLEVARVQRERE